MARSFAISCSSGTGPGPSESRLSFRTPRGCAWQRHAARNLPIQGLLLRCFLRVPVVKHPTVTSRHVVCLFAVQMAVDGVALKAAIGTWIDAVSPGDQSAALQVAEAVRWTEKGLGGFFQFINGITLLASGVSIALGTRYPKWDWLRGCARRLGLRRWRHGDCSQASQRRRVGS
jgi:hypothetical protein